MGAAPAAVQVLPVLSEPDWMAAAQCRVKCQSFGLTEPWEAKQTPADAEQCPRRDEQLGMRRELSQLSSEHSWRCGCSIALPWLTDRQTDTAAASFQDGADSCEENPQEEQGTDRRGGCHHCTELDH